MNRSGPSRPARFTWRSFAPLDGRAVERQLRNGQLPRCPGCGEVLEARPETRLASALPLGAAGYDLDCRECRRFWCVVRHSERSLRLIRMRRLAAAVRAIDPGPARTAPAA